MKTAKFTLLVKYRMWVSYRIKISDISLSLKLVAYVKVVARGIPGCANSELYSRN